ncbi:MAG: hypothetical protein R2724_34745 [Bryobacterales bacterium]
MRGRAALALGLALGWGLACGGGGATDDAAPTDQAGDDDDDGPEEGDGSDWRAARNECRNGLVGVLVGLPGWRNGTGHKANRTAVPLRTAPRDDARELMQVDRTGTVHRTDGAQGDKAKLVCYPVQAQQEPHCLTAAHMKGGFGAPVFKERPGWAQIAVGPGDDLVPMQAEGCRKRVWVELADALEVVPVDDLLEHAELPTTLPNWDGVLYDAPDGAPRPSGQEGKVPFKRGRISEAGGRTWYEVTLVDSVCDTKVEREKGWLPVTDLDGRLQVWFDTEC